MTPLFFRFIQMMALTKSYEAQIMAIISTRTETEEQKTAKANAIIDCTEKLNEGLCRIATDLTPP